ncbi:MAG: alpha/beta hydrolase [Candidatus Dormibacteria bacterium]
MTGWVANGMDAAVKWQLGTLPVELPGEDRFGATHAGEFWAQSRIHQSAPSMTLGPILARRNRGRVEVHDLEAPSSGPGNHPGSRKLMATVHMRSHRRDMPFVLVVHGFAVPVAWWEERQCRTLTNRGAHAARIDQPFHLRRRVRKQRSGDGYLGPDLGRTRAAVRQAVEDCAAVVAWARENVSDQVSVLGVSLGGLVACLLAAHVELDALVAVAPFCDPPRTFMENSPMRIRRILGLTEGSGGVWGDDQRTAQQVLDAALAPIVPRNFTPATSPDRITLIRPERDTVVGPEPIAELAATWGTELWDLRHGHISVMNARGLSNRMHERLIHPQRREAGMRLAG